MKRIKYLFSFAFVLMLMVTFALSVSAATATPEKSFYYSINNKSVVIDGCKTLKIEKLVIPETISGYPVVEIADNAFRDCTYLKDITLPKTLRKIGSYAFDGMFDAVRISDLQAWLKIDFVDGMANPMYRTKNIYLGDSLLEDIVIPEGVTEIKNYAFVGGDSIKSIRLPSSLKRIGQQAIHGNVYVDSVEAWVNLIANSQCDFTVYIGRNTNLYINGELLVDLVIPESVTELPYGAFKFFDSIESVSFHKKFIKADQGAFTFSNNLKKVYVPDLETWLRLSADICLLTDFDTIYIDNEPVVNLVIPDNIDKMPSRAFYNYEKLESVSFSNPKLVFEMNWASGCTNLKSMYVDSYDTWMSRDFDQYGDSILKNIECLYIDGEPVIDYVIPEGETRISDYAFYGYKGIKSITLPAGIEYIGVGAFSESGLENVYVDSLEVWFDICRKNATLNDYFGTTGIPLGCAKNFSIGGEPPVDLVIPETITDIPDLAFWNVKSLRSVTLHKGITDIGSSAFLGCTNLKYVYVPDFTTWSKICRLNADASLEVIYIDNEPVVDFVVPEGTESLPAVCFKNYDKLESITIGSGLKSIGANCFTDCDNLKNVYVDSMSTWFNLKFADDTANPMNVAENLYIAGKSIENLVIDETLTSIPANAFADCKGIKSVTLHGNITSIGENAFAGCTNIESVYVPSLEAWLNIDFGSGSANPLSNGAKLYIDGVLLENLRVPESVSKIKPYAFSGYGYLKTFEITGSPLEIGMSAFTNACKDMEIHAKTIEDWFSVSVDFSLFPAYCNPMRCGATLYIGGKQPEEIVIPESVKRIPDFAFQNCKSLKKITIPATTGIGIDSFMNSGLKEVVIGSLTQKINPVFNLTSSHFRNCMSIEKVTLGYGVKSIGDGAFRGRSNLKEVVMYSGLEEIGVEAFYNSGITSVIIPSTVKEVGKFAFSKCSALESVTFGDVVGTAPIMSIDSYAFKACPKLTAVTFNSGVKKIGSFAFDDSFAIKDVYVNDLVTYLSVEYPEDPYDGQYSSPARCADNIYIDGKIVKNLVIPEGVTRVACNAFFNIESLETVKFPSTLKEIGTSAFASCWNLKDFTLPESLEKIGDFAFFSCSLITKLELKKNVKDIGMSAFEYCIGLKTVYMYPEMLGVGECGFGECKNIEIVLYTGTKEAWEKLLAKNKNTGFEGVAVYYRFRPESMYAPKNIAASQTANTITVSWSQISGVTGYRLYVKNANGWKTVKTLNATSYKVTGLSTGTKYTFAVKAYISSGTFVLWSPEYITLDTATKAVKPSKVTSAQNTSAIRLNWTACPGATGYAIYRKSGNNWAFASSTTSATTHTFSGLKAGTKYTYAVRPYIQTNSGLVWSDYTVIDTSTQAVKPSKVTATQSNSTIKLTWTKCPGATGYRIYYKSGNIWKVAVSTTAATSHSFSGLKAGAKYTFAVRPYIKIGNTVVWSDYTQFMTATNPATVTAKVSSPSKGKLSLSWNAVNGADGYQIYYKTGNGAYKLYKVVGAGTRSMSFNNLKSGTKYTFAVRAGIKTGGGNIFGGYKVATVTVK